MIPTVLPRPTMRWRKHAEVYAFLARAVAPKAPLDYSEEAAQKAFDAESNGGRHDLSTNAYAIGKRWLNVQLEEWRAGVAEGLFTWEELHVT